MLWENEQSLKRKNAISSFPTVILCMKSMLPDFTQMFLNSRYHFKLCDIFLEIVSCNLLSMVGDNIVGKGGIISKISVNDDFPNKIN